MRADKPPGHLVSWLHRANARASMAPRVECLDETTVTLFLAQRLPEAHATSVEGHIDHCDACRRLLSELARARPAPNGPSTPTVDHGEPSVGAAPRPPGDHVDRYVLLRAIGAGGMGAVYAAYDTVLDRKVALKLLRPDRVGDGDSRARLVREAQAMAKVVSPHVVSVFDVGTFDDEVFLSMELVGGGTLKTWLREQPRGWRDVVRVMLAAGRGLAAAHAIGLVHRDFKPDNVLLDGERVCVADFGLAVPIGDRVAARSAKTSLDEPLTITGAIVGTPAYMAPEQLAGEPVDARSDQFSFCVALYEALYAERPFGGTSIDEHVRELQAGRVRDPSGGTAPAWLHAIVLRGLAVDPAARFASMDELLERLDRRSARVVWFATGGAGIVAAATAALLALGDRHPDVCEGAGVQPASYDDAAIRTAFAKYPDGPATATRVLAELERWRVLAAGLRASSCLDARDGVESPQLLDLRVECIADSARRVAALGTQLAAPTPDLVGGAIGAVQRATDLTRCESKRALLEPLRPPDDPALRAIYETLRSRLAVARAADESGRYDDAAQAASAIATDAAARGLRAVEAEAWSLTALGLGHNQHPLKARDAIHTALIAAEAAGDDRLRATLYLDLAGAEDILSRDVDAERYLAQARALVEHLGDDKLRWRLRYADGTLAMNRKQYTRARDAFAAALELHGDTDDNMTALIVHALGGAYVQLGEHATAERHIRRALAIDERLYGPRSAALVDDLAMLGLQLFISGRANDGVEALERAFAIAEEAPGRGSSAMPKLVLPLALIYSNMNRPKDAMGILDRGLAAVVKDFGARSNEHATLLAARARALVALERLEEAAHDATEAVAITRETKLGAQHRGISAGRADYDLAIALEGLAIVQKQSKQYDAAIASYAEALELNKGIPGSSTFDDEAGIGECHILAGRYAQAIPFMEAAIVTRSTGAEATKDPIELADVKANLAQIYIELNRERERTITLLREARGVYLTSDHVDDQLVEVDKMLAKLGVKI